MFAIILLIRKACICDLTTVCLALTEVERTLWLLLRMLIIRTIITATVTAVTTTLLCATTTLDHSVQEACS